MRGSESEMRDGRWGVHPMTIIMLRFLMYGIWDLLGIYGFMGYRNGLIPHSLQPASVYTLEAHSASSSVFGFEFLLWKKRLHSHTPLVRLQQVN